ncbi:MAG: hypothetical protein O7F70_03020 [Gemmatimonadetes bacterium]|nr:hypothetical protein [Gemmatimonadota bacterium]
MDDIQAVERLIHQQNTVPHRAKCSNVQVRIPYRALRRFREILPMQGSLSWFIREAIEEFNEQAGDITDEPHILAVREYVAKLAKRRRARSRRG